MDAGAVAAGPGATAFVDLHCHSRTSFDALSAPADIVRVAHERGLTHLAITDHDRIEGALAARDLAPDDLTVIVGEEVKTADGDLICLFLERPIEPGLPAAETIAAVRDQGGLVGIPHPFDRMRSSMLRDPERAGELARQVDWVETYNARVMTPNGNALAAEFALAHELPGVAASDAHTLLEVAVAYNRVVGDPSTPAGLLACLAAGPELVTGRATVLVRGVTPLAKLVQRLRGNQRVRPGALR